MSQRTSMDPELMQATARTKQRARAAVPAEQDLFSSANVAIEPTDVDESLRPGWRETWRTMGPAERAQQRDRWKERLEPLLRAMLRAVPAGQGVTAAELVDEAMRPTLCSGFGVILPAVPEYDPRIFSFVGPWLSALAKRGSLALKTAKLEGLDQRVPLRREAKRDEAHGNDGLIYLEVPR